MPEFPISRCPRQIEINHVPPQILLWWHVTLYFHGIQINHVSTFVDSTLESVVVLKGRKWLETAIDGVEGGSSYVGGSLATQRTRATWGQTGVGWTMWEPSWTFERRPGGIWVVPLGEYEYSIMGGFGWFWSETTGFRGFWVRLGIVDSTLESVVVLEGRKWLETAIDGVEGGSSYGGGSLATQGPRGRGGKTGVGWTTWDPSWTFERCPGGLFFVL